MDTNRNAFIKEVSTVMKVHRRDRVLVVGCGDGWVCRWLAPQVEEGVVIGLDASDEHVRDARAKSTSFEDIMYLWASPEQIPWQENFFTMALCVDAIASFGDLEKVFRELGRVLEPGGAVWIANEDRREDAQTTPIPPESTAADSLLSGSDYSALLGRLGFEEVVSRNIQRSAANPRGALLVSARKSAAVLSEPEAN
jgi:ubiquinone/menaquinone biosynthesis C-methylase UbiE